MKPIIPLPNKSFVPEDSKPIPNNEPRYYSYILCDADPIIKPHAMHWRVCIESYERNRLSLIGEWYLVYEDIETCIYVHLKEKRAIIGFRGTDATKDLYDDTKLTLNKIPPRATQAIAFVTEFRTLNPALSIELTGHSLGGAIARITGDDQNLKSITFNSAAPPSAPVISGRDETAYHIVFDVVSAWQSPNVTRIDKGYWPIASFWYSMIPMIWLWHVFDGIIPSHSLSNFSKERPGTVVSAETENRYMRKWFRSLPSSGRRYIIIFLMGTSGVFMTSLPPIE